MRSIDENNEQQQSDENYKIEPNHVDYFPSERSPKKQTNAEIAEQGFTVRDGHNPNKPNPYEKPKTEKSDLNIENIEDDFHTDRDLEEEELDNDGNIIIENDEFDNPSDTFENDFQETEEVLEDIDEDAEEEDENQ